MQHDLSCWSLPRHLRREPVFSSNSTSHPACLWSSAAPVWLLLYSLGSRHVSGARTEDTSIVDLRAFFVARPGTSQGSSKQKPNAEAPCGAVPRAKVVEARHTGREKPPKGGRPLVGMRRQTGTLPARARPVTGVRQGTGTRTGPRRKGRPKEKPVSSVTTSQDSRVATHSARQCCARTQTSRVAPFTATRPAPARQLSARTTFARCSTGATPNSDQ